MPFSLKMDEAAERKLLVTYFANSYSGYFKSEEISNELLKLQEYIQETIVKLEELQSLFYMKESEDKEWVDSVIPMIVKQNKDAVGIFFQRLESLADIVQSYRKVFDELESQISFAEQAFGISSSFRNVLSLFKRSANPATMVHSLESSQFVPVPPVDIDARFHDL